MWSVSTQSVSHDIIDRNPSNEPPRSQSRYQAVLTSLCDYTADNNNGMCDKQWCRIPQKALASETLVTLDEFAKRPVRVTVLMMSLWRIHGFSFSRELITSDWHRPRHWGICATADTGRCTGQSVLRWWANNGPTILLSLGVTLDQQYYCLSTWRRANNITVSPRDTGPNITVSPRDTGPIILPSRRWANNVTVSPRDVGPTILLSRRWANNIIVSWRDVEPTVLLPYVGPTALITLDVRMANNVTVSWVDVGPQW